MLTKFYPQPHFLQLKGKRNCSRPLEYVPVAFKCPEIKIESGVPGYLAVPVDFTKFYPNWPGPEMIDTPTKKHQRLLQNPVK